MGRARVDGRGGVRCEEVHGGDRLPHGPRTIQRVGTIAAVRFCAARGGSNQGDDHQRGDQAEPEEPVARPQQRFSRLSGGGVGAATVRRWRRTPWGGRPASTTRRTRKSGLFSCRVNARYGTSAAVRSPPTVPMARAPSRRRPRRVTDPVFSEEKGARTDSEKRHRRSAVEVRDDGCRWWFLGDVPVPVQCRPVATVSATSRTAAIAHTTVRCGAKAGNCSGERGCGDGDDPCSHDGCEPVRCQVRHDLRRSLQLAEKKRLRVSVVTRVRAGADSASREGMVPA